MHFSNLTEPGNTKSEPEHKLWAFINHSALQCFINYINNKYATVMQDVNSRASSQWGTGSMHLIRVDGYSYISMVLNRTSTEDTQQCLKTYLVVTTRGMGGCYWLQGSGQEGYKILNAQGQPPTTENYLAQMSRVPKLRNSD